MAATSADENDTNTEDQNPLIEEEFGPWGECPLDILMLVFENMEPVDLMNCIRVNTTWRDAVNYFGVYRGNWKELAEAAMVNKGIDLRRRANPKLDWRDLYINYRLWNFVKYGTVTWNYEFSHQDIRFLHVYKDILIMESDEDYFKKYYHIEERLNNVTKQLVDANEAALDEVEQLVQAGQQPYGENQPNGDQQHINIQPPNDDRQPNVDLLVYIRLPLGGQELNGDQQLNGDNLPNVGNQIDGDRNWQPNGINERNEEVESRIEVSEKAASEDEEESPPYSYMSDKMIKMLVQEEPFTRLLVVDEDCYYMLNEKNILRCVKWDDTNKRWLSSVLARYFACNMNIADISVYNDDVYMMVKTGLVFKLDRAGRNFVSDRRFNNYFPNLTSAQFEVSRMIYGELDKGLKRAGSIDIPEYGTGKNLVFNNNISVVVSVPCDKEFKITEDAGNIVLEYPGLTCATQHGEVLLLGFIDGRIEICIAKDLVTKQGKSEIGTNVKDCPDYNDENPAIVALEVYEHLHSHHIFAATHSSVYRLIVTYPDFVKETIGLVDLATDC